MKKKLLSAMLLLGSMTALAAMTGCGSSKSDPENTLTILNYGKYFDPDAMKQFEEETGIHVVYEEFETKEQAMKREYAIKQLGRKEKQELIAGKKVKLSDERKEKED